VMGVLNVTPDLCPDGGKSVGVDRFRSTRNAYGFPNTARMKASPCTVPKLPAAQLASS
jgi:hypothetical protein